MPEIIYRGPKIHQDQPLVNVPAAQPSRADNSPPTHPTKGVGQPVEADAMGQTAPDGQADVHVGTQMKGGIQKS